MNKKRLLAIYNLAKQPWAIGEILYFQEQALMKRWEYGVDKIDIVWLYDLEKPAPIKTGITKENSHFYLSKFLPLARVNQYSDAFMLINSLDFLETYLAANPETYYVDPPINLVKEDNFLSRKVLVNMINFYAANGFIPYLSCKPAMLLWAYHFLKEKGVVCPVVVHLRKGLTRGRNNSNYNSWFVFFYECEEEFKKIQFVIIGSKWEIEPRFRKLKNIIFSKDYGTTAEQDCALIQVSLMFMGTASGPLVFARCCGVPYVIFNYTNGRLFPPKLTTFENREKIIQLGFEQLNFQTPQQRLVWKWEEETPELIRKEFLNLLKKVDIGRWKQRFREIDVSKLQNIRATHKKQYWAL